MYLFNVETQKMEYKISRNASSPKVKYAILSHRWEEDELSYREVSTGSEFQSKKGYLKLERACSQARQDGLKYVWVDTCCIDKDSSAELSEAINSMYQWYGEAEVCYAYLSDLKNGRILKPHQQSGLGVGDDDHEGVGRRSGHAKAHGNAGMTLMADAQGVNDCPTGSQWFTRGWTLQELIAPKVLRFYDSDWNLVGTREDLHQEISTRTRIPSAVLRSPYHTNRLSKTQSSAVDRFSIAQRMSWAADRECTREEDRAYSLLGLFRVNMPLLYGEGPVAFVRLQEEIIKRSTDHSIFAWTGCDETRRNKVLAASPNDFGTACRRIVRCYERGQSSYEISNAGLKIRLPICQYPKGSVCFAILNCRFEDDYRGKLALVTRDNAGLHLGLWDPSVPRIPDDGRGFYEDVEVGDQPRLVSVDSQFSTNGIRPLLTLSDEIWTRRVTLFRGETLKVYFPQTHSMSRGFEVEEVFPSEEHWNFQTGVVRLPVQSGNSGQNKTSLGYVVLRENSTGANFTLAFGFIVRGRRNHSLHMLSPRKEDLGDRKMIEERLFAIENRQETLELNLDDVYSVEITSRTEERVNEEIRVIYLDIIDRTKPTDRQRIPRLPAQKSEPQDDRTIGHNTEYLLRNCCLRNIKDEEDSDV